MLDELQNWEAFSCVAGVRLGATTSKFARDQRPTAAGNKLEASPQPADCSKRRDENR